MHFNILALLAAIGKAATASADSMYVSEYCATLFCNRNGMRPP